MTVEWHDKIQQRTRFRSTLTDEERLYLLVISKYKSKGFVKPLIDKLESLIEEMES
jgi:hypothetical protein